MWGEYIMGEFLQTQADKITSAVQEAFQNVIDNMVNSMKDSALNFSIYVLKCIGTFIIDTSEIACPIICLLALAFYISGNRKAGKYVSGSFVFYFIAQALRMVLKVA